jgi:tryptophanyl-tRNA synthetase
MSLKKRVLSGNRPTGRLHWGNYFGALRNWIEIQDEYECYYFVADWHALTTGYENSREIFPSIKEILKDWLSCGLDPKKSTIFLQSWVPEHAELHLLLSMITPLGWLERVPSFKDMQQQLADRDLNMYGFLGYPLLQTADILIYNAHLVPVGVCA